MLPKYKAPSSDNGFPDSENLCHEIFPIEVITSNKDSNAMQIVPIIRAFGMVFSGFLVSSAKKVADPHPKKVSCIKYNVTKMADAGKIKKGVKFAGCSLINPGIINETTAVIVIIANVTNIKEETFIPL